MDAMCGSTGIIVNAVFKLFFALLFLQVIGGQEGKAAFFETNDIFGSNQQKADLDASKEEGDFINPSGIHDISVFIDPRCSVCHKAVENLKTFTQANTNATIKVYIVSSISEFLAFSRERISAVSPNMQYLLDLKGTKAQEYQVRKFPTYIISQHREQRKVEGYVDIGRYAFDTAQ